MKYVKSKGREIRHFPAFVAGMSTHDYVRQYFELTHGENGPRRRTGKAAPTARTWWTSTRCIS
jgi:hypothetical protein